MCDSVSKAIAAPTNGLHDARGELGIGQAAHGPPVGGGEMRPGFGHEQAAVLGQAGEQDIGEVARGRLPAGGNVAHGRVLRRPTACRQCVRAVCRGP